MFTVRLFLLILLCLAGCGGTDEADLLQEEIKAFAEESNGLLQEIQSQRTQIAVTADYANQQIAQLTTLNQQLVATARAGEAPTPERLVASGVGAMAAEMFNLEDETMRFVQIGMAGYVRPADDCFETHQQYYTLSLTRTVYMTAVAVQLRAGTTFDVEWRYENELMARTSWVAPNNQAVRCIALPFSGTLQAGNWTARLFINGTAYPSSPFIVQMG